MSLEDLLADRLVLAALIVAGALLVAALILGLRRSSLAPLAGAVAEVHGRLAQMAESQAATQAAISERLQAQERALAQGLDHRLGEVARVVGERLQQQSAEAHRSLADLQARLAVIDTAQKTITDLSSQVVGLQDLFARKQAQGAFGQVQMEDLIRDLLPPSAYQFQATLSQGRRVDCLLKLPHPPGPIGVDAKFPLDSYRALRDARDEAARGQAARAFEAAIRRHVRDIADRYIVPGETADSALMFVPSGAIYEEVHANFAGAVEEGHRRRVWIVSPTTLWATLVTLRAILRDVNLREQADRIQAEVRALLGDVARLDDRVGKLQRHLEQAAEDIRQIRSSSERIGKRAGLIDDLHLGIDGDGSRQRSLESAPSEAQSPSRTIVRADT
jgi:DNA recombination protein RmuC